MLEAFPERGELGDTIRLVRLRFATVDSKRRRIMGWCSVIGGIVVAAVGFRDPSSTKSDLTFANYALAVIGLLVGYFATSWAMPRVGSWAGGTPFRWVFLRLDYY